MNPKLAGYASAVFEAVAPADRADFAGELRSIERLVVDTPALRSALTDTAVPGTARQAIMREILDGKVSEPARRVSAFAVGAVPAPDAVAALLLDANVPFELKVSVVSRSGVVVVVTA